MRAGARNRLVNLQCPPATGTGQDDERWETYCTSWAAVDPEGSGAESYTVTIPYREGVQIFDRVADGGLLLEVKEARDARGRRQDLELICEEIRPRTAALFRSSTQTYDPVAGEAVSVEVDTPVLVQIEAYTTEETDGTLIQRGDLRATMEAYGLPTAPTPQHSLVVEGQAWSTVAVEPVYLRGQVRRYTLQVRR